MKSEKIEGGKRTGAPNTGKAKARRILKGEEAAARQAEYAKLGTRDKLARLDTRSGASERERTRLTKEGEPKSKSEALRRKLTKEGSK